MIIITRVAADEQGGPATLIRPLSLFLSLHNVVGTRFIAHQ